MLGAVLIGAALWLRTSRPLVTGEITLAGLHDDIEVWRDALGVPHVFAADEHDLHFALGYLHAQDRLWQMELVARVAQGRLAEALGPGLVESDRFLRTLGLWRAADDQVRAMSDATRAPLQAYADGVNTFLATRSGALPPEFLALGLDPSPWTPHHSGAVEKGRGWDRALEGDAAEASRAAVRLGPDTMAALLPGYPDWGPTILDAHAEMVPPPAAALLDAFSVARASNAWVIGGSRTRSGKPILANDMHLSLRAPSLWYLAALHGGAIDVAGMTLPGVPYVIAGHTPGVAWGFTNAMMDDVDFFIVRADSTDPSLYQTVDGGAPFRLVRETIAVKGGDPVDVNVRLTRWGPVLSLGDGRDVAMRWAGHDPSHTLEAIDAFNRAASAADVLAAIPSFDNPHQNVVFADTAGNFGYAMAGRIPRRANGQRPPTLPVPGWTGEWDWLGYLPGDAHPRVLNPEAGFVVTANNRQTAGPGADLISTDWEPPYRAQRITAMIENGGMVDADAVHRMQMDVHDGLADRFVDRAIEAATRAASASVDVLASWDRQATVDSQGAALFYVWYERVRAGMRLDLYGEDTGWVPGDAVDAVLEGRTLPWAEGGSAKFVSIADRAMGEAAAIVGGRAWGDLHVAAPAHALSASTLLKRLLDLDVGPSPAPGSRTTVNVSHYDGRGFPATTTAAASQRHVVDLGNIDGAGFVLPTGQSGLPFDEHYRDQFGRWLNGGLWPVPLDRDRAVTGGVHRLVLRAGPAR